MPVPGVGQASGVRVLNRLAAESQAWPASTQGQTPRTAPVLLQPFLWSWYVYRSLRAVVPSGSRTSDSAGQASPSLGPEGCAACGRPPRHSRPYGWDPWGRAGTGSPGAASGTGTEAPRRAEAPFWTSGGQTPCPALWWFGTARAAPGYVTDKPLVIRHDAQLAGPGSEHAQRLWGRGSFSRVRQPGWRPASESGPRHPDRPDRPATRHRSADSPCGRGRGQWASGPWSAGRKHPPRGSSGAGSSHRSWERKPPGSSWTWSRYRGDAVHATKALAGRPTARCPHTSLPLGRRQLPSTGWLPPPPGQASAARRRPPWTPWSRVVRPKRLGRRVPHLDGPQRFWDACLVEPFRPPPTARTRIQVRSFGGLISVSGSLGSHVWDFAWPFPLPLPFPLLPGLQAWFGGSLKLLFLAL